MKNQLLSAWLGEALFCEFRDFCVRLKFFCVRLKFFCVRQTDSDCIVIRLYVKVK